MHLNVTQGNTVLYYAVHCSRVQYSTVQDSAEQYNTVKYGVATAPAPVFLKEPLHLCVILHLDRILPLLLLPTTTRQVGFYYTSSAKYTQT